MRTSPVFAKAPIQVLRSRQRLDRLEARPVRPGADLGSAGPTAAASSRITNIPWHDAGFQTPPFNNLIIYQLHVGAFFASDAAGNDVRTRQTGRTSTSSTSSNISLNWA